MVKIIFCYVLANLLMASANVKGQIICNPKIICQPVQTTNFLNLFNYCVRGGSGVQLAVSQFILPPRQLAPRGASQPQLACPPPGGQAVPGYLTPCPGYLNPRGASCPGRFILHPAHIKKILLCDVYYYLQHYNNYMQFLSYNYVNLNDYFKHSVGFLIDKGWGASCPGRFSLPPT